jgi:hypothetical protein
VTAEIAKIVVAGAVPVVTALIGVLGTAFQDRRAARAEAGRRELALEEAVKRVTFATEWWNARRLLTDSSEDGGDAASRALAWLEEAADLVDESGPPAAEKKPPITVGRLLLLVPLQRRAARIVRAWFFVFLGLLIFFTGGAITDALVSSSRRDIPIDLILLAITAPVTLGLRFSASAVPEHGKARRIELRRAFLWYRLGRLPANVVRAVFYAWLSIILCEAVAAVVVVREEIRVLPLAAATLITSIGYAVGLRYWAAALGVSRSEPRRSGYVR